MAVHNGYEAVELAEVNMRMNPSKLEIADCGTYCPLKSRRVRRRLDVPLVKQSAAPLTLSLIGLLMTSVLLDTAQHWPVFSRISELFLMIPVLLNLKGNLEMSVTGRLCADSHRLAKKERVWWKMSVLRNAAILIVQSVVSSVFIGASACIIGSLLIHRQLFLGWNRTFAILAAPVGSCLASAIFNYCVLVGVIAAGRKAGIDPENVATPIAAALGDFSSVAFLCLMARYLGDGVLLCVVVLASGCLFLFASLYLLHRIRDKDVVCEDEASDVLLTGWIPIIFALMITSVAGLILERFCIALPSIPILLPVVNGIAGGLVSIYACRMITDDGQRRDSPLGTSFTLILLTLPLHAISMLLMLILKMGHGVVGGWPFLRLLVTSAAQVGLMMWATRGVVRQCLAHDLDPATFSLPLIAAISDLLGTVLLILVHRMLGS